MKIILFSLIIISMTLCSCGKRIQPENNSRNDPIALECKYIKSGAPYYYIFYENAQIVKFDGKEYDAKIDKFSVIWRVDYPKSAESYGIYYLDRLSGFLTIKFYNPLTNKKSEGPDDLFVCEKTETKF